MSEWCQLRPAWKTTRRGLPIDLYASPDFQWTQQEGPLLILGGVHGDEPEGVWLAEETLVFLRTHKNLIQRKWLLVPCINPEGFERRERVNGQGVDLNRNFPCRDWTDRHEKPRYFPGTHPGSEVETQAVVELIHSFHPSTIVHYHSWKPCVVITGPMDQPDALAFSRSSGYPLQSDIGYATPGSLGDYGWFEQKIPVICVECPEHSLRNEIGPQFQAAFQEVFLSPRT